MRSILSLLPLFLVEGCRLMVPPGGSQDPTCAYYEDAHLAWQAVGAAGAGLAGGAGTLAASFADEEDVVLGLSVTAAVMSAVAGVGALLSAAYASRYSGACMGGGEGGGTGEGEGLPENAEGEEDGP